MEQTNLRTCPSGAVRDCSDGKGRLDLLPGHALLRLQSIVGDSIYWPNAEMAVATVLEKGAKHYAARNWEQGMYVDWFLDSGQRHLAKAISGWDDEPHLYMALWNLVCLVDTVERIQAGHLSKEYLGHFINLGTTAYPTNLNIRGLSVNNLICLSKGAIYRILSGCGIENAFYAAICLFEIVERFIVAKRSGDSTGMGILTKLCEKGGYSV